MRRFFTQRPRTFADHVLVWASISIVPFIVYPIIGWLRHDFWQTIVDGWPTFIFIPVTAALVLVPFAGRERKGSSDAADPAQNDEQ